MTSASEVALRAAAATVTALCLGTVAFSAPRPLANQPFPDAHEYADAARHVADGDGYVTTIYGPEVPPRYPPGFSLVLAPFAWVDDYPDNVQRGSKVVALLYVLVAVLAAWSLGGSLAAALAALVVGSSPFARESATLIMSDALAALLAAAVLALLARPLVSGASLAGVLAGLAAAVRTTGIAVVAALLFSLPRRWVVYMLLGAAPALLGVAALQWLTFGSPVETGYTYWRVDEGIYAWAHAAAEPPRGDGPYVIADRLDGALVEWACPCPVGGPQAALANIVFYPLVLLGVFWIYAPPLATLPGLVYIVLEWRERTARFAGILIALTLVSYVFYFYQGARFMAPAATALVILSCVAVARALRALAPRRAIRFRSGSSPAAP